MNETEKMLERVCKIGNGHAMEFENSQFIDIYDLVG